jgi:hypothetical protein
MCVPQVGLPLACPAVPAGAQRDEMPSWQGFLPEGTVAAYAADLCHLG